MTIFNLRKYNFSVTYHLELPFSIGKLFFCNQSLRRVIACPHLNKATSTYHNIRYVISKLCRIGIKQYLAWLPHWYGS
jgi:hypothetical protein